MNTPRTALMLALTLALLALAACGGDEVADDPKLSEEGKAVVTELGGPFSASEFEKFLDDLPKVPELTMAGQPPAGDGSMPQAVADKIRAQGWDEQRFLYIYGHTMHMVSLNQVNDMHEEMMAQFNAMPEEQRKAMEQMMGEQIAAQQDTLQAEVDKQVPASEQTIIRRHMQDVNAALGMQ